MVTDKRLSVGSLVLMMVLLGVVLAVVADPTYPELPKDYTAKYGISAKGAPPGLNSIMYSAVSKKMMRSDTIDDQSKTTYTYYIFFDQPAGKTTAYTAYQDTLCQKDVTDYIPGEERSIHPGAGRGCRTASYLGINRVKGKVTDLWELECPGSNYQLYFEGETLVRVVRLIAESEEAPIRSVVMDYTSFETGIPSDDIFKLPYVCTEEGLAAQAKEKELLEKHRVEEFQGKEPVFEEEL